jgi:AraC family transcriptional regulator, regulatory protein of adaptative response / methylated-DNA-[protein]-cysteine methyltransferase
MDDAGGPVPLDSLCGAAACTPRQLQRDFAQVLGISPRQYGQAVRAERTRETLRASASVIDAVYSSGYGSVRAFYEEAAVRLGMTPSEYVAGGVAVPLLWSIVSTDVGEVIAVATPRGLAAVRIGAQDDLIREVEAEFRPAALVRDDAAMSDVMAALRELAVGHPAPELPVDVQGTAFQARVWSALRMIPAGETRSYTEVAESLGSPTSVRAVARACATNRVALAIPCHRVVRSDGNLAGYRWGLEVKERLIAAERG